MKTVRSNRSGFTLVELVMVIILLAVLAAVAIPNFIDFRKDAKNAATHGALGAMRSAISIAYVAIKLKEDPSTSPPTYPLQTEFSANAFDSNHAILNGTAIMEAATGIPKNPWTRSAAAVTDQNRIYDCSAISKGGLLVSPNHDRGWCYHEGTGQVWANSDLNTASTTENNY